MEIGICQLQRFRIYDAGAKKSGLRFRRPLGVYGCELYQAGPGAGTGVLAFAFAPPVSTMMRALS